MSKFARIENGVALEVFTAPEGFTISDCFHADVAMLFSACPANVTPGSTVDAAGKWTIEQAPSTAPAPAAEAPKIGPIAFKLLFSAQERIKAKQLRPTDDFLEDFWGLLDDPRTDVVDLGLDSVQAAVEYTLTVVKAAGVEIDIPSRKAEILSGQVQ